MGPSDRAIHYRNSEMTSDTAITPGFNKQEPIPGYITKELLGTGGYGEVWKGHAPGGTVQGDQIVYADANSKRASGELRFPQSNQGSPPSLSALH